MWFTITPALVACKGIAARPQAHAAALPLRLLPADACPALRASFRCQGASLTGSFAATRSGQRMTPQGRSRQLAIRESCRRPFTQPIDDGGQLPRYTGHSLAQCLDGGFQKPLPFAARTRVTEFSLDPSPRSTVQGTVHGRLPIPAIGGYQAACCCRDGVRSEQPADGQVHRRDGQTQAHSQVKCRRYLGCLTMRTPRMLRALSLASAITSAA
jgi:hypothetical protein